MERFNKAKEIVDRYLKELKNVEKPEKYQYGGTYHGSTELLTSVGNHLEIVQGNHISYCYGTNIYYKDVYALRVGGAYKFSSTPMVNELKEILSDSSEWKLINDYGTNYSTIGIGKINR